MCLGSCHALTCFEEDNLVVLTEVHEARDALGELHHILDCVGDVNGALLPHHLSRLKETKQAFMRTTINGKHHEWYCCLMRSGCVVSAKRHPDLQFDNICCISCSKCMIKKKWFGFSNPIVRINYCDKKGALLFVFGKLLSRIINVDFCARLQRETSLCDPWTRVQNSMMSQTIVIKNILCITTVIFSLT